VRALPLQSGSTTSFGYGPDGQSLCRVRWYRETTCTYPSSWQWARPTVAPVGGTDRVLYRINDEPKEDVVPRIEHRRDIHHWRPVLPPVV